LEGCEENDYQNKTYEDARNRTGTHDPVSVPLKSLSKACIVGWQREQEGTNMIEAAKVVVGNGEGNEVEERAIVVGLRASTEPYPEDGLDEVLIWTEPEAELFEESLLVQTIGQVGYFEVQIFVPDHLLTEAKAKLQELGIPTAQQLSETGWTPGATYETRY
jgi:hypothetical protein